MPIHDWKRVDAGIFHDFHHAWIEEIKRALNRGILPENFYAMAEQITGKYGPDVVTLERPGRKRGAGFETETGGAALAVARPKTRFHAVTAEAEHYARKANSVVVRHRSGHEVVAVIEVVSPGNKSSKQVLKEFSDKANGLIRSGIHLLIVDLFPPTPRDPGGIHQAIWGEGREGDFPLPPDKPLTCAAYLSAMLPEVFLEPVAVGDALPAMPLFLEGEAHVLVPLDATYASAFEEVPSVWRDVLDSSAAD